LAKTHTPPLYLHLHEYAAETASVISAIEHMQAFHAGEMAGALLARCHAPDGAEADAA
jgi:hypothetical protein